MPQATPPPAPIISLHRWKEGRGGANGKKISNWRAVAVTAGTAALVFLTLIYGVRVWAGGAVAADSVIVPDNATIINNELRTRPDLPKAWPERRKGDKFPAEPKRAPLAPEPSTQVAFDDQQIGLTGVGGVREDLTSR